MFNEGDQPEQTMVQLPNKYLLPFCVSENYSNY